MAPNGAAPPRLCVAAAAHGPGTDLRDPLVEVLDEAALRAGLDRPVWREWAAAAVPVAAIAVPDLVAVSIDRFTRALDVTLGLHNTTVGRPRLRLRVVLHFGLLDDAGCAGPAVDQAVRLLDQHDLRDALDEAPDSALALLLSDRVPTCPWWLEEFREVPLWAGRPRVGPHARRGDVLGGAPDCCDRAWLWTPGWYPVVAGSTPDRGA